VLDPTLAQKVTLTKDAFGLLPIPGRSKKQGDAA
jgi:hypothetical protein